MIRKKTQKFGQKVAQTVAKQKNAKISIYWWNNSISTLNLKTLNISLKPLLKPTNAYKQLKP